MSALSLGSSRYLVDNSAYVWVQRGPAKLRDEWLRTTRSGQLLICAPFMLEALYSATNEATYMRQLDDLRTGFELVVCDAETWTLALDAQRQLAAVAPAFHRRPPADLLLAATAHQHRLGVLHYDEDYDKIAEHTGLDFESRWLAPRGSL